MYFRAHMQNHKKKLFYMSLSLRSDQHLTWTEGGKVQHKDIYFSPLSWETFATSKTVVSGGLCPKWNTEPDSLSDTCILQQIPSVHDVHQMEFKSGFPFGQMCTTLGGQYCKPCAAVAHFTYTLWLYKRVQPPKMSIRSFVGAANSL